LGLVGGGWLGEGASKENSRVVVGVGEEVGMGGRGGSGWEGEGVGV
jgi:hypothetical protein